VGGARPGIGRWRLGPTLQDRRLKVVGGLPLASLRADEPAAFRVKVTLAGNETFESWRERDHDDLVLAVALALWVGSFPPGYAVVVEIPTARRPRPRFGGLWPTG
jgi:hypothetical protein